MADLIDFSGSSIEFGGRLFKGDVAKELKDVVGREVQKLAKEARDMVASQIVTKNGTGYSAKHIVVQSKGDNSLYARVALPSMKSGELPPRVQPPRYSNGKPNPRAGQPIVGDEKHPYIVMAVLESGRYGGRHVNRVTVRGTRGRSRRVWQHGDRRQKGLFMFRRTQRALRFKEAAIRERIIARFTD